MSHSFLRSIPIVCISLTIAGTSFAERFVPPSNDTVIATWPSNDTATAIGSQANSLESTIKVSQGLIERARQPGSSYLYGLAHTTLEPWIKDNTSNAELWVTWARIQQQKHNFDSALEALETAIELEPNNVNAHLIMARTHLIQQSYALAQQACSEVIRSGDFLTASVCNLEVASHQGSLSESYRSLQNLASSVRTNDPKIIWINANLADMAARQGLWQESEAWLEAIYTENDISTLIEWADVKLKLKKYQEVVTKLSAVVERTPSSEDAILIRLALAEQYLNSSLSPSWKQRVAERMALREQRQDLYHAYDLAIFYLDIEPNPEKALQWAKVNWQYAREYKDEALLMRALKMSSEPLSQSNR